MHFDFGIRHGKKGKGIDIKRGNWTWNVSTSMDHTSTVPLLHVVRLFVNLVTLDYFVRHLGLPDR